MPTININFISDFVDDRVAFQSKVEEKVTPPLLNAALTFAGTYGLRIHGVLSDCVSFVTMSGLPAGELSYRKDCTRKSKNPLGTFFHYHSRLISKERSTGRSDRYARDSDKVTGIISALKKNKEEPRDEALLGRFVNSMRYAFSSANPSTNPPTISLGYAETLALVKLFIDNDKETAENYRENVEKAYSTYLDKFAKMKDARANLSRFQKGCHAIGIIPEGFGGQSGTYYLVGDAEYDTVTNGYVLKNYKRLKTLANTPLAADAAIIRTYAQGMPWYSSDIDNELGLPPRDSYLEDIDVAIGYSNAESGMWALIPKTPPQQ